MFGRAIHLYAKRVPTAANPKGVMQYSDYFSNQAVQVCRKDNIVEDRPVNEAENIRFTKSFQPARALIKMTANICVTTILKIKNNPEYS